jgi:hypothetical protein
MTIHWKPLEELMMVNYVFDSTIFGGNIILNFSQKTSVLELISAVLQVSTKGVSTVYK